MKKLFSIFLVVFILLFSQKLNFACTCAPKITIKETIKNADLYILGTVFNKQIIKIRDSSLFKVFPSISIMQELIATEMSAMKFDVLIQKVFKGKISSDTIAIYSGFGGGDCGKDFEIGTKYFIQGKMMEYFSNMEWKNILPHGLYLYWTSICLNNFIYSKEKEIQIEKYMKESSNK